MDMEKKTVFEHNSDDSFVQKILEAMDEEERNNMSSERKEQMLKKIRFVASQNHNGGKCYKK